MFVFNRATDKYESFTTKTTVFPNVASDLVIGMQQIFLLDLIKKLVSKPDVGAYEENVPSDTGLSNIALDTLITKC